MSNVKSYFSRNIILLFMLISLIYFFFHFIIVFSKNSDELTKLKEIIFSNQPLHVDRSGKNLIGQTFKNFELMDLYEKKWELYEIKSKVKIIIVFSIFDCSQCLLEYRLWNDIFNKYPQEEVFILAIVFSPTKSQTYNFVADRKIKFPVLNDRQNLVKKIMGISSTPIRISLDEKNRILDITGTNDSIENYIKTIKNIEHWLSNNGCMSNNEVKNERLDSINQKNK